MRVTRQCLFFCFMLYLTAVCLWAGAESYSSVKPLQRTINVPDVSKADVSLQIESVAGDPVYKLQCHAAGYTGDPDFDYSGDFECRLSSIGYHDQYSTLLTENVNQSRDWESRGRFFSANLRGNCANIPEFGANRNFRLRFMRLTLKITNPVFAEGGQITSLTLIVTVRPDPTAQRQIAEFVQVPKTDTAADCKLEEYFVDPVVSSKSRK